MHDMPRSARRHRRKLRGESGHDKFRHCDRERRDDLFRILLSWDGFRPKRMLPEVPRPRPLVYVLAGISLDNLGCYGMLLPRYLLRPRRISLVRRCRERVSAVPRMLSQGVNFAVWGLAVTLFCCCIARAQIAPGPLSSAHAQLAGVTKCASCHDFGARAIKCL